MGFGRKKSTSSSEEMQNWYQDRYASVAIQRNFLLLFSVFVSLALFVCLMVVKSLQEGKASEPYLIEYDKKSGYMTIVEAKSKQEYTAQQAVKESMLLQYISKREAPKLSSLEEDMNYIRVSTNSSIYKDYVEEVGKSIRELKSFGANPKYDIKMKSLQYTAANRVLIKITKVILSEGKEVSSKDYKITVSFGFTDVEMPVDDMRINPLGFQVTYYKITPIKTFKSALNLEENKNNDENNDNDEK